MVFDSLKLVLSILIIGIFLRQYTVVVISEGVALFFLFRRVRLRDAGHRVINWQVVDILLPLTAHMLELRVLGVPLWIEERKFSPGHLLCIALGAWLEYFYWLVNKLLLFEERHLDLNSVGLELLPQWDLVKKYRHVLRGKFRFDVGQVVPSLIEMVDTGDVYWVFVRLLFDVGLVQSRLVRLTESRVLVLVILGRFVWEN